MSDGNKREKKETERWRSQAMVDLEPGNVLDERFLLEELAGSGGMGTVYRGRDLERRGPVAIKVLHNLRLGPRFEREADLLAELEHPHIVGYVAHGITDEGARYLVTDWLEGISLSDLLKERHHLEVHEAVAVADATARALGYAHERGIVHRDVKPGNLFLVDSDPLKVQLIDFGIAHQSGSDLTETGALIGTWSYMAPEQARGFTDLDARIDVFALGCVFYECLAGRKAFDSAEKAAVLVKILLEDPPEFEELGHDVPPPVSAIVRSLLAKDRDERPADGMAVATAIASISRVKDKPRAVAEPAQRRGVSVVLAQMQDTAAHELASASMEAFRDRLAAQGGALDFLVDGTAVLQIDGGESPVHQAAIAGRCALDLRQFIRDVPLAIAAGRMMVGASTVTGRVIDAGAVSLAVAMPGEIRLDEATARLLEVGFTVTRDELGPLLVDERTEPPTTRLLLGQRTPFVGRDVELATLRGLFDQVAFESRAQVAVIVGPAGQGKSRLLRELRVGFESADEEPLVLRAVGDPAGEGSPFALVGQAVREAAAIQEGEQVYIRQQKLRRRLAKVIPEEMPLTYVSHFLAEMVRAPFPDNVSVKLREARADPVLMGDCMRSAFEAWMAAECDARPVVLILEDMQWGDLPTVRFVDHALRSLADKRLLVLASARPEVTERYPALWEGRFVQKLELGPLSAVACAELIRDVLGPEPQEASVDRIIQRAKGNAFYLEELIRVAAARGDANLPRDVAAMAQQRFDALDDDAKRVVRAASVFGRRFWAEGVQMLTGHGDESLSRVLEGLMAHELIDVRAEARFPNQHEYQIRHALLRDEAYNLLTDKDQQLGHRLAARWLEDMGETDPFALARHYDRGGESESASPWFRRAAEQALEGDDWARAVERAERGLACGVAEEEVAFRLVLAEAHQWLGQYPESLDAGRRVLALVDKGSWPWFKAVSEMLPAAEALSEHDLALTWLTGATQVQASGAIAGAQIRCLCRGVALTLGAGRFVEAQALLHYADGLLKRRGDATPRERGWVLRARAACARQTGDMGALIQLTGSAIGCFEEAGDHRYLLLERASLARALCTIGDLDRAETMASELVEEGERRGMPVPVLVGMTTLGRIAGRRAQRAEANAWIGRAVTLAGTLHDTRLQGVPRIHMATIHLEAEEFGLAELEARTAADVLSGQPLSDAWARATLGRILLAKSANAEAAPLIREALAQLDKLRYLGEGESCVRLAGVELLVAEGDLSAARSSARGAVERLQVRARSLSDTELRRSFESGPTPARTKKLAADLDRG